MKKHVVINKKVSYGINKKWLSNSKSLHKLSPALSNGGSYPQCLSVVLFEYRATLSRPGWRTGSAIMRSARDRLCRRNAHAI